MAITDKTRKILWARSGNRCAICRVELVHARKTLDPESVVGEECHIVSPKLGGPRYETTGLSDYDTYDNLLLLCAVHHKVIDDQVNEYSIEHLRSLKMQHETWVRETLANANRQQIGGKDAHGSERLAILPLINSGKELCSVINGAHLGCFDHDEPETQHEVDLVSDFLSYTQDCLDILSGLDAGQ